jgi:hypothetical protein
VLNLAINNVAQKEEATLKSGEDVAGSRRTQPPIDCLWCLVPSFPGLSVNSDNLPFSYVILFLLFTYVNYMHETWSWHAYRFALGFLWKNRCDRVSGLKSTLRQAFRHSFWSTDHKPYFLPTSLLELCLFSSTRKERLSKHVTSTSTVSKNKDSPLSWDKLVMTSSYVATMITMLGKPPSMLATSYLDASKRPAACTSSLPLGRGPSSSRK